MLPKYKKRDVIIELKGKEQCVPGSYEALFHCVELEDGSTVSLKGVKGKIFEVIGETNLYQDSSKYEVYRGELTRNAIVNAWDNISFDESDIVIFVKLDTIKEAGLSDWIDFANALWESPFEVDDEEEYSHT